MRRRKSQEHVQIEETANQNEVHKAGWSVCSYICLHWSNNITEIHCSTGAQLVSLIPGNLHFQFQRNGGFILSSLPCGDLHCSVFSPFERFNTVLFSGTQLQKKMKGFPHSIFHVYIYKYIYISVCFIPENKSA